MKLSHETEYGLQALILLAQKPPGTVMPLAEIATAGELPRHFLAKIFRKLTQHHVLRSFRGATRGYALARSPQEINLVAILDAIEGPDLLGHCIFWSNHCSETAPCLLHDRWKGLRPQMIAVLRSQTLRDLVPGPRRSTAGKRKARVRRRGRA